MTAICRGKFEGSQEAIELVADSMDLSFEADGAGFWIWGQALDIEADDDDFRAKLAGFADVANMIIGVEAPGFGPIRSAGAVQIVDGDLTHHILLPNTGHFEVIMHPIILSAAGGGVIPRPAAVRARELGRREVRFKEAAGKLTAAGEDFRELYKVAELVEKAHGGLPNKKRPVERRAFFEKLQIEESDWEALHRSARPHRHAEEHDDGGPKISAGQAKGLLHHALKLWLQREVPV